MPVCSPSLLALPSVDARALEVPARCRYLIIHSIFGEIGEHRMTVRREDDAVAVEHTADFAVKGRRAHRSPSHDPLLGRPGKGRLVA